jgi:hypothetical protein
MKNVDIKERIVAIRKMAAYGPTPLEEGILQLIGDLSGVNEQRPGEPDLTKDMPKQQATPEAEVSVTSDAGI